MKCDTPECVSEATATVVVSMAGSETSPDRFNQCAEHVGEVVACSSEFVFVRVLPLQTTGG